MTASDTGNTTSAEVQAGQAPPVAGSTIHWNGAGTDLVVHILAEHQWVIWDGTLPETDARSLIGFIEKHDNLFETTTLYPVVRNKHGFKMDTFPSLDAAIGHLGDRLHDQHRTEPGRLAHRSTRRAS